VEIKATRAGQATVISVSGSIDALTAGDVTDFFIQQIGAGNKQVVADLGQVDFMSSAGLRAFLAVLKESRQQGGDLYIAAPQPGVERILDLSGFTTILKTFPSVAEAVAAWGHGQESGHSEGDRLEQ
jgi:anti-anti-sigma factor